MSSVKPTLAWKPSQKEDILTDKKKSERNCTGNIETHSLLYFDRIIFIKNMHLCTCLCPVSLACAPFWCLCMCCLIERRTFVLYGSPWPPLRPTFPLLNKTVVRWVESQEFYCQLVMPELRMPSPALVPNRLASSFMFICVHLLVHICIPSCHLYLIVEKYSSKCFVVR